MCANGAQVVKTSNSGYVCNCTDGFVGDTCESSATTMPTSGGTGSGGAVGAVQLRQEITFSSVSTVADYTVDMKAVTEVAYAITLRLYDVAAGGYRAGCSVDSTATAARRAVKVVFTAVASATVAATASAAATQLTVTTSALTSSYAAAKLATGKTSVSTPTVMAVSAPATTTVNTQPTPAPTAATSTPDGDDDGTDDGMLIIIIACGLGVACVAAALVAALMLACSSCKPSQSGKSSNELPSKGAGDEHGRSSNELPSKAPGDVVVTMNHEQPNKGGAQYGVPHRSELAWPHGARM